MKYSVQTKRAISIKTFGIIIAIIMILAAVCAVSPYLSKMVGNRINHNQMPSLAMGLCILVFTVYNAIHLWIKRQRKDIFNLLFKFVGLLTIMFCLVVAIFFLGNPIK
jgi:hypothetical protein